VKTVRPTPKTIGSGRANKSTRGRDSAHLPPISPWPRHGLDLDCRRTGQALPPSETDLDRADSDRADPAHLFLLNFRVQEFAAIGRVLA
jgi:hypothetical protein